MADDAKAAELIVTSAVGGAAGMESQRARMVADQLRPNGIHDELVLRALAEVPREEFVPPAARRHAYDDRALGIGWGQTISQPLVVAAMTQALQPGPDDTVLEVGTGSGYQAAVLARLARRVLTVEREPQLAERAAATLKRLGFDNVEVVVADGSLGWPPAAPYAGILVACATPSVPQPLLDQLLDGGRLVIPVGHPAADHQDLQVITRRGSQTLVRSLFPVRFVPLR